MAIPYLLDKKLREEFTIDKELTGGEIVTRFQRMLSSCLADLQAGQKDYLIFSRKLRADFITKVVEAKLQEIDRTVSYRVAKFGRVEINELRVSAIVASPEVDIAS